MFCTHVAKQVVLESLHGYCAVLARKELSLLEKSFDDVHTNMTFRMTSNNIDVFFVADSFHIDASHRVARNRLVRQNLDFLF